MTKRKRRLSSSEKADKLRRQKEYRTIFINGKQKRIKRSPTVDGVDVEEFIRMNADPIWLHQSELWEYIEDFQSGEVSQSMLNRSALVIRAKKPFVNWVQSLPGSAEVDREYINQDSTVYLVPELTSDDEKKEIDGIIKNIYQHIFEEQLTDWITDESKWPVNRDIKTFEKWFTVEFHSIVSDLVEDYLEDDEIEQFEHDD